MKNLISLFRTVLFSYIGVFLVQSSFAQQTGSFDRTINFNGTPNWVLSYYVPANYNAANKSKLIVSLHGLGDTPQNFRDFLVQVAAYSGTNMYNAIIVCPYGGGYSGGDSTADYADFWTTCDTSIITRCMMDAMAAYNIDPDDIYLSGVSIGGRAALRYGLLNYWRFRGLELWTPAVQSMDEANNLTSFIYPYQNGQYIPITISTGSDDAEVFFLPTAYQHLSDAGALVNFQIYYGMGHSAPHGVSDYISEWNYLNSNATSYATNDAGISNIASPFEEVCGASFTPSLTIQNKGINNLTSAIINYQTDNGTINTYNWSGNLMQLARDKVTLPAQSVSAGTHTFKAYTSMPNGVADTVPSNDSSSVNFNSITRGTTSIAEGFEGATFPPTGWRQAGSDSAWGWKKTTNGQYDAEFENLATAPSGANGQSLSCIYFDNAVPDSIGKSYSIRTPQCDFTNASSPSLTYDYAYAPYDTLGLILTDTLAVYYSTDCGSTWHTLLKKGGLVLSTTGGYSSAYPFVPTSSQWKQETIDLNINGLTGQPEVMFSFENRFDNGHMLYLINGHMMYLDNINVSTVTGIVNETQKSTSINIYPNPTNGLFTLAINASTKENYMIEIRNILGQIIYSEKLDGFSGDYTKQLDMKEHGSGVYFLSLKPVGYSSNGLKTQDSEIIKKVIVY